MSDAVTIKCTVRPVANHGYLNQMKQKNFIPGVIYGKGRDNVPVFMAGRELNHLLEKHGSRGLFSLQIEGQSLPTTALIREMQKHPVNGKLIHVDFLAVSMNEEIHSMVSIVLSGEEELINQEGIPQMGVKEVEVLCLARNLPEYFTVDVSGLAVGSKVVAGDLELPEDVELVSDPEALIINVLAPGRASTAIASEETEQTE
jgi:large subunit ribosomal protein L25